MRMLRVFWRKFGRALGFARNDSFKDHLATFPAADIPRAQIIPRDVDFH